MDLLKKFFSFSIGSYISLIIGIFSLPITTRIILPEQYGIFSFFLLIINLGSLLLTLGLDQGFVRYFYEEKNKSSLLYNCLKYPILMWCVLSMIIFLNKEKLSFFVYNENNIEMLFILILGLFISILKTFSFLIVRMNQKGFKYSLLQILEQSFNFILIFIAYRIYKNSYKVLVISYFLSILSVTLISILLEKEMWKIKKIQNSTTDISSLLKYSLPFVMTFSLSWIFSSSDKLIIKKYSNLEELGLYAIAFTVIKLFNIVQTGFTLFWVPVAYERYSQESENKKFFKQVFNIISFIMLLLAIIVLISKNLIILLLGEKYYSASMIIPCLVFMPIMYTVSETTVLGINFSKKTKYHIIISLCVAIFNIIGNIILVSKFGARGAAISTGVAYILFFTLRTYFAKRLIDYSFKLKRFYFISFFIFLYSLYLTFYNNIFFTLFWGIILIIILFGLYFKEIKIAHNYIKINYLNIMKKLIKIN